MGIFNEATKKRMDDLETRKTELNIQIAKEELAKPTVTKDQIICWLEHFRTFDTTKFEHRRRFINTFINRIFLYDDKIIITFNYNKGTKTITFADLEVSGILSHSNSAPTGEPRKKQVPRLAFFYPIRRIGMESPAGCMESVAKRRHGITRQRVSSFGLITFNTSC